MKQPSVYLVAGIFVLGALLFVSWLIWESRKPDATNSARLVPASDPVIVKSGVDSDDVYAALDEQDFGRARALIDEIKSPLHRERLRTEMNQLIDGMWSADAKVENLLDVFLEENCPYEDFWLEVAMRARLGVDAEQALAWFAAHGTKLRATLRDRAVLALCRYYCGLLEWKKARELHGTLKDEELISVVDSEIGAAMDRCLRRDVMIDPKAVMSSLLGKDSGYEVFWLEVAMNELLVKNPIVAGEWYQSNKSSFTPEQHERIALACLRLHLGQNRAKEAKEWRTFIVSEELCEVVDRELGVGK